MSGRWAIAALLLLTPGCRPKPTLPALPEVDLTGTRGAVREAIESAMMAARSHPNDAALVARLGMVLHAHHQMASAARAYQRAAQLDPAQADYGDYLGTALAADGHYAQALEPLRASLQLRNSAPVRLRLANALYESGQRAEARVEYERLVAADATNAAAHYGLGRCLDGVAAAAEWQRAIELYPHYGGAKFALASLYRQAGRRAEAESLLENYERDKLLTPPLEDPALAAVEALDASATGLLRAARSLEHQGQVAPAALLQERALSDDPQLVQAWVNLISLYARLGQPAKAEAAYRKSVTLEPNNAEAHYNYGVLCTQTERWPEAQRAFEAAVAADPRFPEALDNLGLLIQRSGAADRAAALFRRALAAKPGLRLARYHLAGILANQRRFPEAIRELEKAVETVDDQTAGYRYALGATHARAGANSKAIEVLERARAEAVSTRQSELGASIERDLAALRSR